MATADHIPEHVRSDAALALEASADETLERAFAAVRECVPRRYQVEVIEARDGTRRLYWPRSMRPGPLFEEPG